MLKRACLLGCVIACLGLITPVTAQEGHPLTGTWGGDWGPNATTRNHLTFVLNWDGKNVTGSINPGPDSITLASVYLDVANWTVRFEADAKDALARRFTSLRKASWKTSVRTIGRSPVRGCKAQLAVISG